MRSPRALARELASLRPVCNILLSDDFWDKIDILTDITTPLMEYLELTEVTSRSCAPQRRC